MMNVRKEGRWEGELRDMSKSSLKYSQNCWSRIQSDVSHKFACSEPEVRQ